MPKIVHALIAKTAKEIAFEAYEVLATNNDFYRKWPKQKLFVRRCWDMFIPDARSAMLKILEGDYPEEMKQPVYEALVIDGAGKGQEAPASRLLH